MQGVNYTIAEAIKNSRGVFLVAKLFFDYNPTHCFLTRNA